MSRGYAISEVGQKSLSSFSEDCSPWVSERVTFQLQRPVIEQELIQLLSRPSPFCREIQEQMAKHNEGDPKERLITAQNFYNSKTCFSLFGDLGHSFG